MDNHITVDKYIANRQNGVIGWLTTIRDDLAVFLASVSGGWQPIETAPIGKELLLYDGGEISSGAFVYKDDSGRSVFTWGWSSYRCPKYWAAPPQFRGL